MNLNPKNWFELQKKRQETRDDLIKETGATSWHKGLEEKPESLEEMNALLGAIASGTLSNLSLDKGAVDAIAKSGHIKHLQETLEKLNKEAKEFSGTKTELMGKYREQSKGYDTYQKTNQELSKLDELRDETDRAIFDILKNGKGEGFTRADESKLAEYEKIKGAIASRAESLERNPETALFVRMHILNSYHEQLVKENYIETPSRTENIDWIKNQMKNHRAVLLEGATGTGGTRGTPTRTWGLLSPEVIPVTRKTELIPFFYFVFTELLQPTADDFSKYDKMF